MGDQSNRCARVTWRLRLAGEEERYEDRRLQQDPLEGLGRTAARASHAARERQTHVRVLSWMMTRYTAADDDLDEDAMRGREERPSRAAASAPAAAEERSRAQRVNAGA